MKTKNETHQKIKTKKSSGIENRNDKINKSKKTPLPKLDYDLRRANRQLPTEKVLQTLKQEAPGFFNMAEVVGKWIWIQFRDKQPHQVTMVLSQLGFHWNNKRQAWQHPCGNFTQKPASYDPRERYGSQFPSERQAA